MCQRWSGLICHLGWNRFVFWSYLYSVFSCDVSVVRKMWNHLSFILKDKSNTVSCSAVCNHDAKTFPVSFDTDKWWLARCSDSFVSDIAHRRTRECSFGYFQLNISISTPHLQKEKERKKKTWTDLPIHSIKQRNYLSHSFGEVLWNPNEKKKETYKRWTFGIQTKSFTIKVCSQWRRLYRFHIIFRGLGLLIHS